MFRRISSSGSGEDVILEDEVGECFVVVGDPVGEPVRVELVGDCRLERLGARRVDIGQTGAETWVVLADPEGNEFCILRADRP